MAGDQSRERTGVNIFGKDNAFYWEVGFKLFPFVVQAASSSTNRSK